MTGTLPNGWTDTVTFYSDCCQTTQPEPWQVFAQETGNSFNVGCTINPTAITNNGCQVNEHDISAPRNFCNPDGIVGSGDDWNDNWLFAGLGDGSYFCNGWNGADPRFYINPTGA